MKPETSIDPCCDETMQEIWRLKEENAAAHNFDADAIAAAARKRQESHRHRVVSRHGERASGPPDGT